MIFIAAGLAGFLGVALGALKAHGAPLDDGGAGSLLDLASRYLLVHAGALIGLGAWQAVRPGRLVTLAAVAMIAGLAVFAAALVTLAWTGARIAALATPIGGTLLLAAWALVVAAGVRAVLRG